jgi:RimJ/RimL family protein N-acetyltransferase
MRAEYRELCGERLRLRPPHAGDARDVFASFGADPEVTRYLTWRPHRSVDDAQAALAGRLERLAKGVEYSWMLEPHAAPALVGIASVWLADGGAELGYVLARAHWNRGLATEAAVLVRDWAFGLPDVQRVWATCDVENLASMRVLEKAGLARAGLCERPVVRPNLSAEPRPSLLFVAERARA